MAITAVPRWAERDPRIAAAIHAAAARIRPLARPYASESDDDLLAVLAEPARAADWRPVLRELRRRPPDLRLLNLVDAILAADGAAGTQIAPLLGLTLARLGTDAVPAARVWAATPDHPLLWTAFRLLAAHGDDSDAPAVVAGLDWLDNRPEDLCGYDELIGALARIGGSTATAAVPRLRRLWYSPHSYERPAYLQALVALDPTGAERFLVEGLWDCETKVRLLAAQRAPLTDMTRERLHYLRDDPIENADVRAATSARLG
ncbi:hypothetical protein AB0368_07250 [Actinoplanes sp. NPDC051475]|uniref:hypothetical protein n=1 Tax=Actinoplanes sp. NPDC051475 TaxID=3157225 RepID=UPI00344F2274